VPTYRGLEGREGVAEGEAVAGEVSLLQCGRGKGGGRYCHSVCGRWVEYLGLRIILYWWGGRKWGIRRV
jgi:hypothetical protein